MHGLGVEGIMIVFVEVLIRNKNTRSKKIPWHRVYIKGDD